MTDTTTTADTQPILLAALTTDEWDIVDFHRRMSDDSKDAVRRFGGAMAAADGGFDYQRSALERDGLVPLQEDVGTLNLLRLLPEDEKKSAIQALKNLLAEVEQKAAEPAEA
ncbi:hypothetical protein BJP27_06100 [Pseudomonas oryzihabitans]|nr:hypothetical protein BJP27_06100 [Pseudomonas psychrotolerans]